MRWFPKKKLFHMHSLICWTIQANTMERYKQHGKVLCNTRQLSKRSCDYGRQVHRPCTICISSRSNPMGNSIEFFLNIHLGQSLKSSQLSDNIGLVKVNQIDEKKTSILSRPLRNISKLVKMKNTILDNIKLKLPSNYFLDELVKYIE